MSLDKSLYNFARRGVMPTFQGGVGSDPMSMGSDGRLLRTSVGREFFVAGNWGSNTNDGSSWDKAFLTLAAAITANNADVAADKYGWATRNRIYLSSDTTTETLVAFPNKCDVIGVGSYDANDRPGITGQHAPVASGHQGSRWINIWWKSPATAAPIITLTSASAGVQLIDCVFDGVVGTVTHAISATASTFLKVLDCKFIGGFATADIYLAGACVDVEIARNIMMGSAGDGILTHSGTTVAYGGTIHDNFIAATSEAINDVSSKFYLYNNRGITAAAQGTAGAGCIVGGAKMMQDNRISASDVANAVVPAQGSLA